MENNLIPIISLITSVFLIILQYNFQKKIREKELLRYFIKEDKFRKYLSDIYLNNTNWNSKGLRFALSNLKRDYIEPFSVLDNSLKGINKEIDLIVSKISTDRQMNNGEKDAILKELEVILKKII